MLRTGRLAAVGARTCLHLGVPATFGGSASADGRGEVTAHVAAEQAGGTPAVEQAGRTAPPSVAAGLTAAADSAAPAAAAEGHLSAEAGFRDAVLELVCNGTPLISVVRTLDTFTFRSAR